MAFASAHLANSRSAALSAPPPGGATGASRVPQSCSSSCSLQRPDDAPVAAPSSSHAAGTYTSPLFAQPQM